MIFIAKLTGAETTAKLIKMKVLIVGMRGIGIETAKNLALQGAGGITVSFCFLLLNFDLDALLTITLAKSPS
jgi:molybdopterin/thiamine biosynthesis adenylyltransferase